MNTIRQWIAARPWTAVILAWSFGTTSAIAGLRPDWLPHMLILFCIGLVVMVLSMWKFTSIMLAAMMAMAGMQGAKAEETQTPTQFEPAGAAGVAVVVVVVGGVCIYFLVKTCQRLFPKTPPPSTNSPPEFIGGGVDSAGAWSYYAVVSCYEPQSEQWPTSTMELSGVIQENEHGPFFNLAASRRLSGIEGLQDYDSFQSDLARHGITMGPEGTKYFGRNGKPAYEQETPIRFSEVGSEHIVTINSDTSPSVPMVVQRSYDLKTWTDFGYVSVPVGQPFKLIDTTTRQSAFYRIQPR